jgi:hypothetical protein
VLVGEMAASFRGAPVSFSGVDICVPSDQNNLGRLALTLQHLGAAQRASEHSNEHHASFDTRLGRFDCIESDEDYSALMPNASDLSLGRGVVARVAALTDLAAGSVALPELSEEVKMAALTSAIQIPAPPPPATMPPGPSAPSAGRPQHPAKAPSPQVSDPGKKKRREKPPKPEKGPKKVKEKRAPDPKNDDRLEGADARPSRFVDRVLQKFETIDSFLNEVDSGKKTLRKK